MTDIKQFFLTKLSELVPCNEQLPVLLGSLGFATCYDCLQERINPILLYMPGPLTEKVADHKKPFISVQYESLRSVFTKRIKNTPFYISYLNGDGLIVYLLDYYAWSAQPVIYRLMHVEFLDKRLPFVCRFPDPVKTDRENIFSSDSSYYAWHTKVDSTLIGGELTVFPSESLSSFSLITAISTHADALALISIDTAIETYYKLEARARAGHIRKFIRTQNKSFNIELDTAWAQIKGLTPDLQIDPYLLKHKAQVSVTARGTAEICRLFGLGQLSEKIDNQIDPGINQNAKHLGHAEFYSKLSRAFHTADIPADMVIAMLQTWWNRYSQPVFEIRLREMLDQEAEFLFILYALAQQYKLIWAEYLLRRCKDFKHVPELHLLAKIYRLMVIKSGDGISRRIYRGNFQAGNLIQLNQITNTYRYSRFANKIYSQIRRNDRQICKIDKEVNFEISDSKKIVQLIPAVIPLNEKVLEQNMLIIEINGHMLSVPMAWSQVTLDFHNFRLRWLLKKDRFQLTCRAGKLVETIKINGELVAADHSRRIKLNLPVKKSPVQTGLLLADALGRSSHLRTHLSTCNVVLSGWIQDRYKIFTVHFNLIVEGKQRICTGEESGKIACSLSIGSQTQQVDLVYKKYREPFQVKWIKDKNLAGFLSYSPESDQGYLLVLLSKSLENDMDWIKDRLKRNLGFIPILVVLSDKNIPPTSGPILCLVKNREEGSKIPKNLKPLMIEIDRKNKDIFSGIAPLSEKI